MAQGAQEAERIGSTDNLLTAQEFAKPISQDFFWILKVLQNNIRIKTTKIAELHMFKPLPPLPKHQHWHPENESALVGLGWPQACWVDRQL